MKKDLVQGKTTTTTHALRYQHWMDTTVRWFLANDFWPMILGQTTYLKGCVRCLRCIHGHESVPKAPRQHKIDRDVLSDFTRPDVHQNHDHMIFHMMDSSLTVRLWLQYSGRRNVNSNEFVAHINDIRAPLISSLRARGAHCWDADFYMDQYPDLRASGMAADEAWEHFVNYGQFEDRVERWVVWYCLNQGQATSR